MNDNKLMQKVSAIFSLFMVLFYLGAGFYLIFFFKTTLNSAVMGLFGGAFILYGLYRGYTSYVNIVRLFFRKDVSDD
jgi:multisubunit Na+/H+ antiporter MnhE subunit